MLRPVTEKPGSGVPFGAVKTRFMRPLVVASAQHDAVFRPDQRLPLRQPCGCHGVVEVLPCPAGMPDVKRRVIHGEFHAVSESGEDQLLHQAVIRQVIVLQHCKFSAPADVADSVERVCEHAVCEIPVHQPLYRATVGRAPTDQPVVSEQPKVTGLAHRDVRRRRFVIDAVRFAVPLPGDCRQ